VVAYHLLFKVEDVLLEIKQDRAQLVVFNLEDLHAVFQL
jgi:hypothetical protein